MKFQIANSTQKSVTDVIAASAVIFLIMSGCGQHSANYSSHQAEEASNECLHCDKELFRAVSASALISVKATDMQTKTTGAANNDGTWNLWSEGYLEHTVSIPSDGSYNIDVGAYGSIAQGVWPKMDIILDGQIIETVPVSSTSLARFNAPLQITSGQHRIRIAFTNDAYNPPEDRNLYVSDFSISQTSPTTDVSPASRPASEMFKSTGADNGDGTWNLYANGYLESTFTFSATAQYDFSVQAFGSPAAGVWPTMELRVDNVKVGSSIQVNSASLAIYKFTGINVSAGAHNVQVAFTNDHYAPPEDRNLYVKTLAVQGSGGSATNPQPPSTPTPVPATPTPAPQPTVEGFYVATNGNDGSSGSAQSPFRTLARAQTAMRSSSIKTVYVRAGTYPLSAPLKLNGNDKGETWVGYPGETAILDGGGADVFDMDQTSDIKIQNFTIRNVSRGVHINDYSSKITIRWNRFHNCALNCIISNYHSDSAYIDSNSFDGGGTGQGDPFGRGLGTYHAAIYINFGSSGNVISRNLIQNFHSAGITLAGADASQTNNNNVIDRNIVKNVNITLRDSGAIYLVDRGYQAVGNKVTYNYIDGNGTTSQDTKAIYLDDQMSNVEVTGNICRNCGQFAVQYHGGDHITVKNNIFDLSSGAKIGIYQDDLDPGLGLPNRGMNYNVFKQNILYFSSTSPSNLWDFYNNFSGSPTDIALPDVSNNLYWSASGASISNSGVIRDSSPKFANPQFASPSTGNYTMPNSSPAYSQIGFVTLPNDLGPLATPGALPQ